MASRADDGLLKGERQQRILARLTTDGRVVATELQAELGVSAYTIRRDLDELADAGRLQRVHGGALAMARSPVATTYEGRGAAGPRRRGDPRRRLDRAGVGRGDPAGLHGDVRDALAAGGCRAGRP
jgi:DeoR-like protein with HTH domain